MKTRQHLTLKQQVDIIERYRDLLEPMSTIAPDYGISRQAVWKIIRKHGIETIKKTIPVSCHACSKEIMRNKARIRKQLHHFCSMDCYTAYLQAGEPHLDNRQGRRIARYKVGEHFTLQAGHVVHHKDNNQLNNELANLLVIANQGDHVRLHRDFDITPLWDGKYI